MLFEDATIVRAAVISDCRRYRYLLSRQWWPNSQDCVFIMLNPSTADASEDDATIRKCMGFARRWGYGSIKVLNLFAFRATSIPDMLAADDPVGPENDLWLSDIATFAGFKSEPTIVLAWGTHGIHRGRDQQVIAQLREKWPACLWCLGKSKHGHPKHPLYIPYAHPLERFA